MRLLPEEVIELSSAKKRNCFVLELEYYGSRVRYWVDKRDYRVLRTQQGSETITFKRLDLNRPVAKERFTFSPPPGAR